MNPDTIISVDLAIPGSDRAIAWPPPPERHPVNVYLAARRCDASRRAMMGALRLVLRVLGTEADVSSFPWHLLRAEVTGALAARLCEQAEPSMAQKAIVAVRGVLKAAWRLGYVSTDDYQRAIDLEPIRGSRVQKGRALTREEVSRLLLACREAEGPRGIRDAALVALLYGGGLRRSEPAELTLDDYDAAREMVTVRAGKGNKGREVRLMGGAAALVDRWIAVRGNAPGPLFYRINKGGRVYLEAVSEQAIYIIVERLRTEAGVAAFTPHDLRRTAATHLDEAGVRLSLLRDWLGHESTETTRKYLRHEQRAIADAVGKVRIPE